MTQFGRRQGFGRYYYRKRSDAVGQGVGGGVETVAVGASPPCPSDFAHRDFDSCSGQWHSRICGCCAGYGDGSFYRRVFNDSSDFDFESRELVVRNLKTDVADCSFFSGFE